MMKYKYGEAEEKGSDHFGKKSASMCGFHFVRLPENATDPNIREETFMNLWSADSEQVRSGASTWLTSSGP